MNKETIYKTIRNAGIGLYLGAAILTTCGGIKAANKNNRELYNKYAKITFDSLLGIGAGAGVFASTQNKLNKLERKVKK